MVTLSTKQHLILDWIRQFIADHNYPPTVREIGAAFAIKSTANVAYHLDKIEAAGKIHRDFNVARGLRLLETTDVRSTDQVLQTAGR